MKIAKPSFEIISPLTRAEGIEMLKRVENYARISHRSEDTKIHTDSSWERFIQFVVVKRGDWSVTEHVSFTVMFHVNRGVTHEMVRHRLFGFTQESTRFVNYSSKDHEAIFIPSVAVEEDDFSDWCADLAVAEAIYLKWLKRGYAPEIARDHLPHAVGAKIAVTGNLREWHYAMLARTTIETHEDFRAVTIPLLAQFKERIPILFDDIVPEERQSVSLSKPR